MRRYSLATILVMLVLSWSTVRANPCPMPIEPPAPGVNTYDFLYLAALSDVNTPITSDDGTLADTDSLMLVWQKTTPPFPETLSQSVVDPAGLLLITVETEIETVGAGAFGGAYFGDLRQFPGTWTVNASDGTGLIGTRTLDVTTSPTETDTDADGIPDIRDPDDDNDGICDALDTEPFNTGNNCTSNDGTNATLAGATISSQQTTCASKESVDVSGTTNVGIDGDLRLISERVSLTDSSVTDNGRMEVINADPCPGCSVCGNGFVEAWEQCDDGNTVDSDGCSSTCLTEL